MVCLFMVPTIFTCVKCQQGWAKKSYFMKLVKSMAILCTAHVSLSLTRPSALFYCKPPAWVLVISICREFMRSNNLRYELFMTEDILPFDLFLQCIIDEPGVWKSLKVSHLNFSFLAFSTNFWPIKTDPSGNSVWPQALGFQKLAKLDHFCPLKM